MEAAHPVLPPLHKLSLQAEAHAQCSSHGMRLTLPRDALRVPKLNLVVEHPNSLISFVIKTGGKVRHRDLPAFPLSAK
jgi:hypothetical protein